MRSRALSISGSRKLSKLDRIRAHYIDGKILKPADEQQRIQYVAAHALLCAGFPREQTVQQLMGTIGLSRSQCYIIVKEAIELLGDITKTNKDGKRYILGEWFLKAAQHALNKGDLDNHLRALEGYAKINGLYDFQVGGIDMSTIQLPQQIIFSSDTKVLIQTQQAVGKNGEQ